MAPEINNNTILRVKHLIQNSRAMTLATAGKNTAWAAPVYYVNKGACFYFFSSPTARHIEEALASGQAACAIYAENASWQNIMGLQMSGKIQTVSVGIEASKAVLAYVNKFPVVKTFFSGIKSPDLNDLACKFHAKLYCFNPDIIFFMDNSVQFGFRKELKKEDLFK